MSYNNPCPVAVGLLRVFNLVTGTPRLLAVRRATTPGRGLLAFPGGYVDELESAEVAVAREMREETGLVLPPQLWSPVATRVTSENRLLVFLLCRRTVSPAAIDGFVPNAEVTELVCADRSTPLVFPLHQEILRSRLWS